MPQATVDRRTEENGFATLRAGQLGSIELDAAATYHGIALEIDADKVDVEDFDLFNLRVNNDTIWTGSGEFFNVRQHHMRHAYAADVGKLCFDFKEFFRRNPQEDFLGALPVSGNNSPGTISAITLEQRLKSDSSADVGPGDVNVFTRTAFPLVDGQGNDVPPGFITRIQNQLVRLTKGKNDIDFWNAGGKSNEQRYIRRVWFNFNPDHVENILIRDRAVELNNLTMNEINEQHETVGFAVPEGDWFVYDPVGLRSFDQRVDLFQHDRYNLLLSLIDLEDGTEIPDDATVYVEYHGSL